MTDTLTKLAKIIEERKVSDPSTSYVALLQSRGLNKILEKVGEEAIETILAARDIQQGDDKSKLIYETADLWFHTLVMLSNLDLMKTHRAKLTRALQCVNIYINF